MLPYAADEDRLRRAATAFQEQRRAEGEDPGRARSATRGGELKMYDARGGALKMYDTALNADFLGKHAIFSLPQSRGAYHKCDECVWMVKRVRRSRPTTS